MAQISNIKTILFGILCVCFTFYLYMGISAYIRDRKSKVNINFFILSICCSLWAIGHAFMLISPNIEIAGIWRIISAFGWCLFNGVWLSFLFSINDSTEIRTIPKYRYLIYIPPIIFFISNLLYPSYKIVGVEPYGFVENLYTSTPIGKIYNIYVSITYIISIIMICYQLKNSKKNRVKKQMKIILVTSSISIFLALITDCILPMMGYKLHPTGVITLCIGMSGMWYAINKHKMMAISYELVSEYLFESVNEPIFILGQDFLVKNCNKASLNLTGYELNYLEQKSLETIIDFKEFDFNTITKAENVVNIEVDLITENKEPLACELSTTCVYDEYKDVLGIVALLHDISERKNLSEIQKKHSSTLLEANLKLKDEIEERLVAEKLIHHLIYYDTLTELSNRKKMLEDIDVLLKDKDKKFAVLFVDLDKFKKINDSYGHEAGDTILKTVSERVKNIIRFTDTIYRIGGDEFIIILRDLKSIEDTERIVSSTLAELRKPIIYKNNKLCVGGSIGISVFPEHGIEPDILIKRADLAMYVAKEKGGNGYVIYSPELKGED